MADFNVLAADPSRIKAGGEATSQVADLTHHASQEFQNATAYDVQDPAWGNDSYGSAYVQNYLPVHRMMLDGIKSLANAVAAAGALTTDAGKSLENAQHSNTEAINKVPDPHTSIRK
ncbi:hypothetical protein ABTY96_45320 [Streptomyces sp. NPDC096057]|uniref:hypothetical protein n=1 Tax=Streptomyces sp. NPDC096057 TaxID=3155543 RepID=UPI00331FFE4B